MEFNLDQLQMLPIDEDGLSFNEPVTCSETCGGGPTCWWTGFSADEA